MKINKFILNLNLRRTMEQSGLETEEPSLIETGGMFTLNFFVIMIRP